MVDKTEWFLEWFNEDYLELYAHRDEGEAEDHVDFLLKNLTLSSNMHILDLACGSGRHAILFGKLGYHITGVDTSEFLIREAINNSKELPTVRFICRDMREIMDLGPFDVILSMFTSFGYFDSDEENQELLNTLSKILNPGGLFFMDYLHASYVVENLTPKEMIKLGGEEVLITRKIQDGRIIKTIEFPGRTYEESVKLYTPETLSNMLEKSGFNIINQWGNYNGELLTPSSERVLSLSKLP